MRKKATTKKGLEFGLTTALKIGIHPDHVGYIGFIAILAVIGSFVGSFGILGLIQSLILATLCMRVFNASAQGVEAGLDAPVYTDRDTGDFAADWVYPGLALNLWYAALVFGFAEFTILALGEPPFLIIELWALAFTALFSLLLGPALYLVHATGSLMGFALVPTQIRFVVESGGRYFVPWMVTMFAGWLPFRFVYMAGDLDGPLGALQQGVVWALCACAFGATGGAMGWLARDLKIEVG